MKLTGSELIEEYNKIEKIEEGIKVALEYAMDHQLHLAEDNLCLIQEVCGHYKELLMSAELSIETKYVIGCAINDRIKPLDLGVV